MAINCGECVPGPMCSIVHLIDVQLSPFFPTSWHSAFEVIYSFDFVSL